MLKLRLKLIIFGALLFACWLPAYPQTSAKTLLILKQSDIEPIPTIIKNVRSALKKSDPNLKIEEVVATDNEQDTISIATKINPTAILLVGKDIGKPLAEGTASIPIVISDMLKPVYADSFPHDRIVVNSLYIKAETRIEYIMKIIPNQKVIGIIYNPKKNSDEVTDAEQYAKNYNLTIKKFPVDSEKDIQAIRSMDIDILLLIPDTLVCNVVSLRHIMELCLLQKIPIMGISEYFAQTGTIMAISPNFEAYSNDLAETTSRVLRGIPTSEIPNTFPRKIDYFINASMAKVNKVNIKENVVSGARKVFGQ